MVVRATLSPARTLLNAQIQDEIAWHGPQCCLNHLDISGVDDMSELFHKSPFNGDISRWDVAHVMSMESMFEAGSFNGDISGWDVSNVKTMHSMFRESRFNGDLSRWNTSRVENMGYMFANSSFVGDISQWNVGNALDMYNMFESAAFSGDLSQWDMGRVEDVQSMFMHSSFNGDVSTWRLGPETVFANLFRYCPFQGDFPRQASRRMVAGGALSADYRGRFNNQYSLYDVECFFGGVQPLNDYLRETASRPLDRLHFEKLVGLKTRPDWATPDVFGWVKGQQPVLFGLGMKETEMAVWLQENFPARHQEMPSYSLDDLVL